MDRKQSISFEMTRKTRILMNFLIVQSNEKHSVIVFFFFENTTPGIIRRWYFNTVYVYVEKKRPGGDGN